MKKQRLILLVILAIMIITVVLIYSVGVKKGKIKPFAAYYPVTMSLFDPTLNIKVGATQNIDIKVDNASASTYIASAVIKYDPNLLEVVDQNPNASGIQITSGTSYPNQITNYVDTSNPAFYLIRYEASVNLTDTANPIPVTGTVTLGTIPFKAKAVTTPTFTTVTIVFTPGSTSMNSSGVSDLTATNLLTGVQNGNYYIFNASVVTTKLSLQGRIPGNSNSSNIAFTVYQPGTSTEVYSKTDIVTDATGNANFTATGLGLGTYDILLRVPYFLNTKKTGVVLTDPATIDFGQQLAGDLDNNNQINMFDYSRLIGIWRTKTGDANFNPNFDIAQNGEINIYDYSLLISNWRRQGAL